MAPPPDARRQEWKTSGNGQLTSSPLNDYRKDTMVRMTIRWAYAVAAVAVLILGNGCETMSSTTLEENSGAYYEARRFLEVGKTTREQAEDKFGAPTETRTLNDGGTYMRYIKRETVIMNAYTNTPVGTAGSMIGDFGGYQHTIDRTTIIELFFDQQGILAHYRINRGKS